MKESFLLLALCVSLSLAARATWHPSSGCLWLARAIIMRLSVLSAVLHTGAALSIPHAVGNAASPQQLALIEHAMPLLPPHRYEHLLREAFAERGEILRWYIARVDEANATAIAEVVILPNSAQAS